MRRKSSLSVEDIWPEYREWIEALEDIARFIVQSNPNVRRVLLFGSMARGTADRRSDADVAIILKEDHRRPLDRIPEFLRYFIEAPMPVDVLVYTEDELAQMLREGRSFARHIAEEGRVLAEA